MSKKRNKKPKSKQKACNHNQPPMSEQELDMELEALDEEAFLELYDFAEWCVEELKEPGDSRWFPYPRLDVFYHGGQYYTPFYTFGQWWKNPGRFSAAEDKDIDYEEWLTQFRWLQDIFKEEHNIELIGIDGGQVLIPDQDSPAIVKDFQPVDEVVIVDPKTADREPEAILSTIYCDRHETPLCVVSVAHDAEGIIAQREYFPTNMDSFDQLLEKMTNWYTQFETERIGVALVTGVGFCDCCGELAGRTFDDVLKD